MYSSPRNVKWLRAVSWPWLGSRAPEWNLEWAWIDCHWRFWNMMSVPPPVPQADFLGEMIRLILHRMLRITESSLRDLCGVVFSCSSMTSQGYLRVKHRHTHTYLQYQQWTNRQHWPSGDLCYWSLKKKLKYNRKFTFKVLSHNMLQMYKCAF